MGCAGCCRAILMAFNMVFFIIGAAALGVGIWVIVDASIFLELLGKIPNSSAYGKLISDAAYIIIAGGAFIFLVAFLGCCGAWKKNKCLLYMYATIVAILLLVEIGVVVTGYFFYDTVANLIKTELANIISTNQTYTSTFSHDTGNAYNYVPGDLLSKGVDALQLNFACCGINNYTDYMNGGASFPVTCCPLETGSLTVDGLVKQIWDGTTSSLTVKDGSCPTNTTFVAEIPGCYQALYDYVTARSLIFIGVAGGTAGLQLILIIMACGMARSVAEDEKKA